MPQPHNRAFRAVRAAASRRLDLLSTIWRERTESSQPLKTRQTCVEGWVRLRSKWMQVQMDRDKRGGASPSLPGFPVTDGLNERSSLRRSTRTGEPVVFDRHSGVDLVDAVAASTANGFGVPPFGIGNDRFIDGGYRRNENADLAVGYERVLVLSPFGGRTRHPEEWHMQLAAQVDELRSSGSTVETIFPDSRSRRAFGSNMMDPSRRRPSALAGYEQGMAHGERLTKFWH